MRARSRIYQTLFVLLLFSPVCSSQSLAFNEIKPEFGEVAVGQTSAPKIISVSNVSSKPLFIVQIISRDDFAQSNMCPIWLPEGSGCLVSITFTPLEPGPRTGKLAVYCSGSIEQSIELSGLGIPLRAEGNKDIANAPEVSRRTTNDEEKARGFLNDKRYSFEALLSGNSADIALQKVIFALTKDSKEKQRIASILVAVGVTDRIYSDYLMNEAKKALAHDHDMPWPFVYGEDGMPKSINPALNEWCKERGLGFWAMDNVSYFEIPNAWYFLGAAGDPRAYDLLVRGLYSPNLMIAGTAAEGLARLQDPRAIDELITAGHKTTGEARGLIALSLLFFPDDKAQAAAEEIMPTKEKNMLEVKRREIKARGLKTLFPW